MAGRRKKTDAGPRATAATVLADRKNFGRFTERDAELLAGLRPVFEQQAGPLVDEFYAHLQRHEHLRGLLQDPATIERLKRAQRAYLISLTSGVYDEAYAESRVTIGKVHERIGLQPQWYLGTYGLYLELLAPHIERHHRSDPALVADSMSALGKLMILDMQMVLDAYHERHHKRAVERSERLAAVGELSASIAHEVRNPLAGMRGAIEVLRRGLSSHRDYQEILDEVLAQIDRLELLVRDLLNYANPQPVHHQPFDLHEMLDRALRYYMDQADSGGITIQRSYGPGTARLTADPQQMEQVFLNLIQNAVQAMEQGGVLALTTHATSDEIVICFQDSGNGIPKDVRAKIFQPFYTTKHRGSGLGLSIVGKIVEAHGGDIDVESEPGRGTAATVTIPLHGE